MILRFVFTCLLLGLCLAEVGYGVEAPTTMHVSEQPWGSLPDGKPVSLFTLRSGKGMIVTISNYGGIIVDIRVPDKNGAQVDVNLGKDSLAGYLAGHPGFGALIGRYANRIAHGKFSLEGKAYQIPTKGKHALHGGLVGFDDKLWAVKSAAVVNGKAELKLHLISADGEEGFPGEVSVDVIYALTADNELEIHYHATTTQATVINLTNHAYFNLGGHDSGSVAGHEMVLHADHYTPTDDDLIPTGELASVKGTPMDFTTKHTIGERIDNDFLPLKQGKGYDHNYVLSHTQTGLKPCAEVYHPGTGIRMVVQTTLPAVQLYTANNMKDLPGKAGAVYVRRAGFCLETQHYPDSPNHSSFPSTVLQPGAAYSHKTFFRFSVQ